MSSILEIELYLTKKLINLRGTGYKPIEGDGDQELRDELKELRNKLKVNEMAIDIDILRVLAQV